MSNIQTPVDRVCVYFGLKNEDDRKKVSNMSAGTIDQIVKLIELSEQSDSGSSQKTTFATACGKMIAFLVKTGVSPVTVSAEFRTAANGVADGDAAHKKCIETLESMVAGKSPEHKDAKLSDIRKVCNELIKAIAKLPNVNFKVILTDLKKQLSDDDKKKFDLDKIKYPAAKGPKTTTRKAATVAASDVAAAASTTTKEEKSSSSARKTTGKKSS